MPEPLLSVIVITKNEARNIEDCLDSVAFADERIVVDAGSSDGTAALAESRGARVVVTADWPGFGAQKNRALALAGGTWVLCLDADERVSPALASAIRAAIAVGPTAVAGYELQRLSSFCGRWMRHGDWYPDRVLRLFRRGRGAFSSDLVHERLDVDGGIGRLQGELLHHTMATLEQAIDKMNRYSSGRAVDRLRAGEAGGLARGLLHGAWAFIRGYVLRCGFLDGRHGLVLALYVAEGTCYRYLKMAMPSSAVPPGAAEAGRALRS